MNELPIKSAKDSDKAIRQNKSFYDIYNVLLETFEYNVARKHEEEIYYFPKQLNRTRTVNC